MTILTISSSFDVNSRSEKLARLGARILTEAGCDAPCLTLRDYPLPPFDNGDLTTLTNYLFWHDAVSRADSLVLASPVYNWGYCAELKKFVEFIGSTPPSGQFRSALFNKVVTFVNAAGLPHSYMSFLSMANSMMLDFKCIINPFNVHIHNGHWENEELGAEALQRIHKSLSVAVELTTLLQGRTHTAEWEI